LIAEREYLNGMDIRRNGDYGEIGKIKPIPHRKSVSRLSKGPDRPPRRPGPKPEFNAMAAAEKAAVTAVESQLCEPLRADGPPLGFEFDPLPPHAFEELAMTEVPHTAGVNREDGSENYSERTALQSQCNMDHVLTEK